MTELSKGLGSLQGASNMLQGQERLQEVTAGRSLE